MMIAEIDSSGSITSASEEVEPAAAEKNGHVAAGEAGNEGRRAERDSGK